MLRKIILTAICILLLTGCGKENGPNIENTNTTTMETPTHTETQVNTDTSTTTETPVTTDIKDDQEEPVEEEPITEVDYQAVKPNEMGNILVVMYHGIFDNPPYHRKAEDFRKDLQYMYDNGYRLISMKDYLSGNIDIPAGTTPIVLTFDDGLPTTFSLEEKDGVLVPVKDTAVAIIEEFNEKYPEFGRHAIFYVNTSNGMFTGAGTEQERLQWLVDRGYEISTHTATHINLTTASKEAILKDIGGSIARIKELLGDDYETNSIAYPFGSMPSGDLLQYALDGTYEETTYSFDVGLHVGVSGPFVTPYDVRFNKYKAPRVRGSEGDYDLWNFFGQYEKNPSNRYISDGMKSRLSVPKGYENNINKEALPENMEIYIYD